MNNVLKEWFEQLSEEDKVLLNSMLLRNEIKELLIQTEKDLKKLQNRCTHKEQVCY